MQRGDGSVILADIDNELDIHIADLMLHSDHIDIGLRQGFERVGHQAGAGNVAADHGDDRHGVGGNGRVGIPVLQVADDLLHFDRVG